MPAAFYYYPEGAASLEKITLNARITRLDPSTRPIVDDAYGGDGHFSRSFMGVRRRVRIAIDRVSLLTTNGKADHRAIQGLLSHLRRGGACGFTTDTTKAVAMYPAGGWVANSQILYTAGNAFTAWESSAVLAAGDEVVVESAPIYGIEEYGYLSAWAATQPTLTDKLNHDYGPVAAFARWHRFYPALRLPSDAMEGPLLTNEHGIGWSLDVELEVDPAIHLLPLTTSGAADTTGSTGAAAMLGGVTDIIGSGKASLETILEVARLATARAGRSGMAFDPRTSFTDFARGLQVRRF